MQQPKGLASCLVSPALSFGLGALLAPPYRMLAECYPPHNLDIRGSPTQQATPNTFGKIPPCKEGPWDDIPSPVPVIMIFPASASSGPWDGGMGGGGGVDRECYHSAGPGAPPASPEGEKVRKGRSWLGWWPRGSGDRGGFLPHRALP